MKSSQYIESYMNGRLKQYKYRQVNPKNLVLTAILFANLIISSCNQSGLESTIAAIEPTSPQPAPLPETNQILVPSNNDLDLDGLVPVGMGGYAFKPIAGYLVEVNVAQATITDDAGNILLSMTGTTPAVIQPIDQMLADFIANIAGDGQGFVASTPYEINIAGTIGLAADIQGVLVSRPFHGRVAVVKPSETSILNILGMGLQTPSMDYWQQGAEEIFNTVVASIQFFEPTDSACYVSQDSTYGYTSQQPIRVGGGAADGLARAEQYLGNLVGPDFEPISYKRLRTDTFDDALLEVFEITAPGQTKPALLYLDTVSYEPVKAPYGFKCPMPFNITKP